MFPLVERPFGYCLLCIVVNNAAASIDVRVVSVPVLAHSVPRTRSYGSYDSSAFNFLEDVSHCFAQQLYHVSFPSPVGMHRLPVSITFPNNLLLCVLFVYLLVCTIVIQMD